MQQEAESRLAGPRQPEHVVHVYDLAEEDVARQRGDALAVRGQHAPALATQKFPRALADVHPKQAQPGHERAVGDADGIGAAGAEEVELVVANETVTFPVTVDAEAEPRILRAEAHFVELTAGNRIAERNAAETAANTRTGRFVAPHGGGIHEADRHDGHIADLDLQRGTGCRALRGILHRIFGARSHGRQVGQSASGAGNCAARAGEAGRLRRRLACGLLGRPGSRRGQSLNQLLLRIDRLA